MGSNFQEQKVFLESEPLILLSREIEKRNRISLKDVRFKSVKNTFLFLKVQKIKKIKAFSRTFKATVFQGPKNAKPSFENPEYIVVLYLDG